MIGVPGRGLCQLFATADVSESNPLIADAKPAEVSSLVFVGIEHKSRLA